MKNDSRDDVRQLEVLSENRFAVSATKAIAVFREVGNRIKRMTKAPSDRRIRDLRKWAVAEFFRPLGRVCSCFFDCCAAVDSVYLCDIALVKRFKSKANWFCDMLTEHLAHEHADAIAAFLTLIGRLADLAEVRDSHKIQKEKKNIELLGRGVLEELCFKVQERELKLRNPPKLTTPTRHCTEMPPEWTAEETKEELRKLVQYIRATYSKGHITINDAVELIMSARQGVLYYERADRIRKAVGRFDWSISTVQQYAKNAGKYRNSHKGAAIQAAKRKKRKLVDRDTKTYRPPK